MWGDNLRIHTGGCDLSDTWHFPYTHCSITTPNQTWYPGPPSHQWTGQCPQVFCTPQLHHSLQLHAFHDITFQALRWLLWISAVDYPPSPSLQHWEIVAAAWVIHSVPRLSLDCTVLPTLSCSGFCGSVQTGKYALTWANVPVPHSFSWGIPGAPQHSSHALILNNL